MEYWKSYDANGNVVYIDKNYPKKNNNSFDDVIKKDFGTKVLNECKRCGKILEGKNKKRIFCSRECASIYKNKTNEMKSQHGKEFTNWLNNKV